MFVRQFSIIRILFDALGLCVKYNFYYDNGNTYVYLLTQKESTFVGTASDYNLITGATCVMQPFI
jgi:hypothetical protein